MELTFKPFKLKAASGEALLSFRAFQGSMRISIFEGSKMVFDRSIPDDRWIFIRNSITKASNISPGQKIVLIFSAYNSETKKSTHDWVLTISKDDKQCYALAVEFAEGGKYVFPIRGPFNVSLGSDPLADGDRSLCGLDYLIDFINNISPIQRVLSNNKEYWTKMIASRSGGKSSYSKGAGRSESSDGDDSSYF